jgi:pyrroline-5-carboxylate reductase
MASGTLNLVVVGGGNMGGAVVAAALAGRRSYADVVRVAEPDEAKREKLRVEHSGGVSLHESAAEAIGAAGMGSRVVLAVKPQVFPAVAEEIVQAQVLRDQLFISIMAGVRTSAVFERLGGGKGLGSHIRVTRAMPNLGLSVGEGMTCVCAGPGATSEDMEFTTSLFDTAGKVVRAEEELFDAFTAVASSGLAYVFYLAQAMVEGAVAVGFERGAAVEAVKQTVVGAGALLKSSVEEPGVLVAGVKSKGGTTEAALNVLDQRGLADAVVKAITAARDRGRDLGTA